MYSKLLVQLFLDLKDYDCEKSQNCVQNVLKSSRLEILKKCTKQWSEPNLIGMAFKKCYSKKYYVHTMYVCSLFFLKFSCLVGLCCLEQCIGSSAFFHKYRKYFRLKIFQDNKKVAFSFNTYPVNFCSLGKVTFLSCLNNV